MAATYKGPLATAAAMGGAGVPGWNGLVLQDPADSATSYFTGGSLPAGWSLWNPGSLTSQSTSTAGRLKVTQASHPSQGFGGVVRAAPAYSAFCMTACVHGRGIATDFAAFGVIIGGADMVSAPTTARILVLTNTLRTGPAVQVEMNNYQRYNLFDTTHATLAGQTFRYLRVFFNNASLGRFAALVSADGCEWHMFASINRGSAALGTGSEAPGYIGVGLNNFNSSESLSLTCPMFRVDETTDPYLPCGVFLGG